MSADQISSWWRTWDIVIIAAASALALLVWFWAPHDLDWEDRALWAPFWVAGAFGALLVIRAGRPRTFGFRILMGVAGGLILCVGTAMMLLSSIGPT